MTVIRPGPGAARVVEGGGRAGGACTVCHGMCARPDCPAGSESALAKPLPAASESMSRRVRTARAAVAKRDGDPDGPEHRAAAATAIGHPPRRARRRRRRRDPPAAGAGQRPPSTPSGTATAATPLPSPTFEIVIYTSKARCSSTPRRVPLAGTARAPGPQRARRLARNQKSLQFRAAPRRPRAQRRRSVPAASARNGAGADSERRPPAAARLAGPRPSTAPSAASPRPQRCFATHVWGTFKSRRSTRAWSPS